MVIGFDTLESRLTADYSNQKLHHAILLVGKRGIGKSSFAKEFAHKILGNNLAFHPDLLLIEKENSKREIAVEQIRKINNFIHKTSTISNNKFIIIDAIDELTISASNALLKMLEEPNKNNFLILICHSLSKILPTIKSRCKIIKINNLSSAQFKEILHNNSKFSEAEIFFLEDICEGSIAMALNEGDKIISTYFNLLNSIKTSAINDSLSKDLADKNFDFTIFIAVVNFFLMRLCLYNQGLIKYLVFNEREIFQPIQKKTNLEKLFFISQKIKTNIDKSLGLNLDKKLITVNIINQFSQHFLNDN